MSVKKQASNRNNAARSTSSRSAAGKKVVSQNARRHCIQRTYYRQMDDQERIKELVHLYRDSAQIRASVDLIGRYQSALDNELYKAMCALLETQRGDSPVSLK